MDTASKIAIEIDDILLFLCISYQDKLEKLWPTSIPKGHFKNVDLETCLLILSMSEYILFTLKCDKETRERSIGTCFSNYLGENEIENSEKINALFNNRFNEYGKCYNNIEKEGLNDLLEIHSQVMISAIENGINRIFTYGSDRLNTELINLTIIKQIDQDFLTVLLGRLKGLEKLFPNSTINTNGNRESVDVSSSHNYVFCHIAIPSILLAPGAKLNDLLLKSGEYLNMLWNYTAQRMRIGYDGKLEVFTKESESKKIIIVNLPKPKMYTECLHVVFILSFKRNIFKKEVTKINYFTMEYSYDYENNKECYMLCSWISPSQRDNHGKLPDDTFNSMMNKIESMYLDLYS